MKSTSFPCSPLVESRLNSSVLTDCSWEITWEYSQVLLTGRNYYVQTNDGAFDVQLAPDGSVYHNGFKGLWRWQMDARGGLLVHIGGDYPVGWGMCEQQKPDEILVCFYEDGIRLTHERMRWRRKREICRNDLTDVVIESAGAFGNPSSCRR